jgi:hypothetical protein
MANANGIKDAVHRTGFTVGERLLRELQLKTEGRVRERRDLLLDKKIRVLAECWRMHLVQNIGQSNRK